MRKNLANISNFFFQIMMQFGWVEPTSAPEQLTMQILYVNPSIHSGCACTTYRLNNQNQQPLLVNVVDILTRRAPKKDVNLKKKKRKKKELHIGNIVATFSLFTYQMNNSTDIFRHFESSQHFHLAGSLKDTRQKVLFLSIREPTSIFATARPNAEA